MKIDWLVAWKSLKAPAITLGVIGGFAAFIVGAGYGLSLISEKAQLWAVAIFWTVVAVGGLVAMFWADYRRLLREKEEAERG